MNYVSTNTTVSLTGSPVNENIQRCCELCFPFCNSKILVINPANLSQYVNTSLSKFLKTERKSEVLDPVTSYRSRNFHSCLLCWDFPQALSLSIFLIIHLQRLVFLSHGNFEDDHLMNEIVNDLFRLNKSE